ncbi:NAD(P)-binding protein [Fomitopsis serialis]|uniref:NAD(P)-binding protein n=1 Tax=Fomitopsis serialis TaxID=139415 RepID=UPI0020076CBC|nr:NAD(P)-binding protein [Neoantrodia serialis]KAH9924724.1 NAD(P)-binding protein [Neoantrodia serialis]
MSHSLLLENMFRLSGRVALVTGGGTGIGWMIAEGLAVNGAKVYITGRRKDVLENAAKKFADQNKGKGSVVPLVMDVTDKASIAAGQKVVQANEGKLHILVNNAGISGPLTPWFNDTSAPQHKDPETLGQAFFDSASYDDWSYVFGVNTFSVHFLTTAFLGLLAKGSEDEELYTSSVINITSLSGSNKLAQNQFAYNATKAAATHLTKMFATELALKKIPVRVNSVAPGVYESEMTYPHIPPEDVDKIGKSIVPIPARRAGRPEEVAGTVIYLVSPAGCYTNGQEIIVDGGYTAVNPAV